MHIALVTYSSDPARGGAERYTADLATALRSRGHEAVVLAAEAAPPPAGPASIPLRAAGATRAARYTSFLEALDEHLRSSAYDVVHAMLPVRSCDVYQPHGGIAAEALAAAHRKHGGPLSRGAARLANRWNTKRRRFAAVERELLSRKPPPVVLCVSDLVGREARAHYRTADRRIVTLLNGVDLERFDPASPAEGRSDLRGRLGVPDRPDATVGLLMAQNFRLKGLREAIIALRAAGDEGLVLAVVGRDDPRPYQQLARRVGVAGRVLFPGATGDPASWYRAADFFVLPTRRDSCSLATLEALAMGLPAISTRQNGAMEAVTHGQEGYVLDDTADVAALAGAMRTLADPAVRARMHRAALELRPRLSYTRHVDRLVALYEEVRERKRGARGDS